MTQKLRLLVEPSEEAKRLDRLLADRVPGLGRRHAATLIATGQVRVNGRRARKGDLVEAGDELLVELNPEAGAAQPAPDVPLVVLLEREDVVVVAKPAGVPSAALFGKEGGTLAGALLARYPEMARVGFGAREPGLIHRLDTDTSGVIVAARSTEAFLALRAALEGGALSKRYLALVESARVRDAGVVELPLAPDPKNARRVVVADGGHPARSEFRVVLRGERWALVEVKAGAAYRHQVRAHLAAAGSPLLGDVLYGGLELTNASHLAAALARRDPEDPTGRAAPSASGASRHALHASQVTMSGAGCAPFDVSAPLPRAWGLELESDGVDAETLSTWAKARTSRSA